MLFIYRCQIGEQEQDKSDKEFSGKIRLLPMTQSGLEKRKKCKPGDSRETKSAIESHDARKADQTNVTKIKQREKPAPIEKSRSELIDRKEVKEYEKDLTGPKVNRKRKEAVVEKPNSLQSRDDKTKSCATVNQQTSKGGSVKSKPAKKESLCHICESSVTRWKEVFMMMILKKTNLTTKCQKQWRLSQHPLKTGRTLI